MDITKLTPREKYYLLEYMGALCRERKLYIPGLGAVAGEFDLAARTAEEEAYKNLTTRYGQSRATELKKWAKTNMENIFQKLGIKKSDLALND